MKIGFIGLGKLGLPVALAIENAGHDVVGYDINPTVKEYLTVRKIPYSEEGTPELLAQTNIKFVSVDEVIAHSEIVFCPVQTPHDPKFEGVTRLPVDRVDFDYTYLKNAVKSIADSCEKQGKDVTLVIISTVLPTTVEREILPLLNDHISLCYNPFFIAMGTTRKDFENPEFVLLGCDSDPKIVDKVVRLYGTIHNRPVYRTSIKNAELIKVVYNTYISTKISFINTVQEICHKTGADIDAVSDALALATERIISPKYLRGGMPDGGGCHPRDNIALSFLARELDMNFDWFENIILQREATIDFYADLIAEQLEISKKPIIILGEAFKRGTNLTVGSPARLLSNVLNERLMGHMIHDPHTGRTDTDISLPAIFFVATNHPEFEGMKFPKGSIVIDVWGIIKPQKDVRLISVGRNG